MTRVVRLGGHLEHLKARGLAGFVDHVLSGAPECLRYGELSLGSLW
ncbi:hypothetical protein [Streptomyces sp. NPDC088141]